MWGNIFYQKKTLSLEHQWKENVNVHLVTK
jgi:hypothetical protein